MLVWGVVALLQWIHHTVHWGWADTLDCMCTYDIETHRGTNRGTYREGRRWLQLSAELTSSLIFLERHSAACQEDPLLLLGQSKTRADPLPESIGQSQGLLVLPAFIVFKDSCSSRVVFSMEDRFDCAFWDRTPIRAADVRLSLPLS